jgi:hypothetical protein
MTMQGTQNVKNKRQTIIKGLPFQFCYSIYSFPLKGGQRETIAIAVYAAPLWYPMLKIKTI